MGVLSCFDGFQTHQFGTLRCCKERACPPSIQPRGPANARSYPAHPCAKEMMRHFTPWRSVRRQSRERPAFGEHRAQGELSPRNRKIRRVELACPFNLAERARDIPLNGAEWPRNADHFRKGFCAFQATSSFRCGFSVGGSTALRILHARY